LDRARAAGRRHYTKRTAEAWLREVLDQARSGTLPGMTRTGVTFAEACEE
jgi:integrase